MPAYIGKDGDLSQTKTSGVSRKQFEYLQKYMNKIIKQISEEIMSGNIDIHPYYKKKKTILHELAHIELNQLSQSNSDLFAFQIDKFEDDADNYIKF